MADKVKAKDKVENPDAQRRGSAGCPPVPPGHKPVAVVFDLVHPLRPVGGCSADEGKQGSMKPVGARNNMWRN